VLYERIFPRWRPRDEYRPRGRSISGAALRVEWLGTAGFVIRTEATTLLIDPFLSRPSLLRTGFMRLSPTAPAWLPAQVDAVLCGHSHYDHLLDAPGIAAKTGAKLCGSRTTCAFGRAAGVPEERLVEVPASGRVFEVGDITVRFVPSLHGRLGRTWVPFPGEVPLASSKPGRVWH
jgi:L-ascorbate metabolism protein UlaG (beta-lactamase superfamily)